MDPQNFRSRRTALEHLESRQLLAAHTAENISIPAVADPTRLDACAVAAAHARADAPAGDPAWAQLAQFPQFGDAQTDLGTFAGMRRRFGEVGPAQPRVWYDLTLDDASRLSLRLTGLDSDVDLFLYDAHGATVAISDAWGDADENLDRMLPAGQYRVLVAAYDPQGSPYRLTLQVDAGGDDFGAAGNLGTLTDSTRITDWAGRTDLRDYYRFEVADPRLVRAALTGLSQDLDLFIYDANGTELAAGLRGGSASEELELTLAPGTYYARVAPYLRHHSNYALTLSSEPLGEDRGGDTLAAATELGELAAEIELRDSAGPSDAHDYFRFTLPQVGIVRLELDELTADLDLSLLDAAGAEIAWSWAGGSTSEAIETPLPAGVYHVLVAPYMEARSEYRLHIAAVDLGGDTLAAASDLGELTGGLELRDAAGPRDAYDYFRFTLPADGRVNLQLDELTADLDLFLLDAEGTEIARSWEAGSRSESLRVELPAGVYHVLVAPWTDGESLYRLRLTFQSGDPLETLPDVPDYGGANDWNLNAVGAPEAWAFDFTGQGVIVAVLDTGVDYFHQDLAASIWTNAGEVPGNGIDDDGNGFVDDVRGWDFAYGDAEPLDRDGHGTHVAGTIAAARNGFGATGVAYGATIMPVQVLRDNGEGTWSAAAAGIRYAADNGAHIINMSLGGGYSEHVAAAIAYAQDRNVLIVASAGNDYAAAPGYPARFSASYANVLSVGAYDDDRFIAEFSNAVGTSGAVQVDAPGVRIYSTLPGDAYGRYSGTSMAAPHVAGLAALVLSSRPGLSAQDLRSALVAGARDVVFGSDAVGGANAATTLPRVRPDLLEPTDAAVDRFAHVTLGEAWAIDGVGPAALEHSSPVAGREVSAGWATAPVAARAERMPGVLEAATPGDLALDACFAAWDAAMELATEIC